MASTQIQNNFVNGEISPALYGRSDLAAYYHAAASTENFVIAREGSLKKRSGIVMDGTIGSGYANVKVFAYTYDRTDYAYMVFKLESVGEPPVPTIRLTMQKKDTSETAYGPVALYENESLTNDDIKNLHVCQIGDTLFVTSRGKFSKKVVVDYEENTFEVEEYAQRPKPVWSQSANISVTKGGSGMSANEREITYGMYYVRDGVLSNPKTGSIKIPRSWPAGGYVEVTVTHRMDLNDKDFDYILIGKKSGSFFGELARFYPDDVTETTVSFQDENHTPADVIYSQTNVLGEGFTSPLVVGAFQQRLVFANAPTNHLIKFQTTTLTAGNTYTYSREDGVNRIVSVTHYTSGNDITSSATVSGNTITVVVPTGGGGKYNISYVNKEPDDELPMTLWFSAVGNLYNFYASRPASDEDPFSATLMSTGPSFIRWISCYQKTMVVFTDAGIFAVDGSPTEGFSASRCQITKLSNLSVSNDVQPLETEVGVVFVSADNKTLYTLSYDVQVDSKRPVNRMTMVKHITREASITSMALQQYPDQVVWCALSDGTLASFTFEQDEKVFAWSRHTSTLFQFVDVVHVGTVTDFNTNETTSDVLFVIRKGTGGNYTYGTARWGTDWKDAYGAENAPVVAELVTLPVESTNETIAWNYKNIKDVKLRIFETGPVKVKAYGSGLADMTLNEGVSYSGDAKVMPMGFITDLGQMHFVSDSNTDANILAVIFKMEVD